MSMPEGCGEDDDEDEGLLSDDLDGGLDDEDDDDDGGGVNGDGDTLIWAFSSFTGRMFPNAVLIPTSDKCCRREYETSPPPTSARSTACVNGKPSKMGET